MTVRANKPAFSIREKLKELQKPIGLKGSELMRAETAQEARDLVSAGRKNLIINGELQIWQRGTSISATYSSRPYTADMIRIYNVNSGSGATFSRDTDVPSEEFAYSLKRDTNGYNGHSEINLPVELNQPGSYSPFVPGETYTFSYWAKSDSTWVNICRARWSTSVSSGTYVSDKLIKGHSGGGGWEKVIHQFTMDTDPGSATFFSILIGRNNPHVGVNYFTGFQLERGKNATEFEHRSYGEELALCQRYYQQDNIPDNNVGPWFTVIDGLGSSYYRCTIFLPTPMRIAPSVSWTTSGDIGATYGTQFIDNYAFTPYTNTGSGAIHISGWTATAEL